jgi:putative sterol carrier protein
MAKAKKTKEENLEEVVSSFDTATIREERWIDCEWCFQFDDGEPHVFAWTDDEIQSDENPEVNFTISNAKQSYISFTHGESGKTFKLFSRELTDRGRELRKSAKERMNNLSNQ